MLDADFHSHTLFSGCGIHTVIEMLSAAREKGVKALAITDHGKLVGGKANNVFFERMDNPVNGIRLLKGIEANLDGSGGTDTPQSVLKFMDIVLLGIHDNIPKNLGAEYYTKLLIDTIKKAPYVDLVSHPNNAGMFPLNHLDLCKAAIDYNFAIELNNSKIKYSRTDTADTMAMLEACVKTGCMTIIASDAHCITEIGEDRHIRTLLNSISFPEHQIVNSTYDKAIEFIDMRKKNKR
ncbi:MAG: PHP domain-containing protein [Fibrobacteres bacterium]|nr:PHP domain-containing protein [Fibrobacterota bacterium]